MSEQEFSELETRYLQQQNTMNILLTQMWKLLEGDHLYFQKRLVDAEEENQKLRETFVALDK
jgi:hypothetical protein